MSVYPSHQTYSGQPANSHASDANQPNLGLGERNNDCAMADVVRLASNENPLGCSPHVTLAITARLGELSRYPDETGMVLKKGLADFYGLDATQIVLGNGANELLDIIADTVVDNAGAIVFFQYSVSRFQLSSLPARATPVQVAAKGFHYDLPAMLNAIQRSPTTRLVYLANPNNPTGTLLSRDEIRQFIKQIPSNILVVIDEGYIEFSPQESSLELMQEFNNVLILRTFSKAYGLAGLRMGYAIAHPRLAAKLNQTRQAYNTNVLADAAAMAALRDQGFLQDYVAMNDEQKQVLYNGFDSLGLEFIKSAANFILVNVGNGVEVYHKLLEQGILVRPMAGYGLEQWIRVSVGLPEENLRFLDTLGQVLA